MNSMGIDSTRHQQSIRRIAIFAALIVSGIVFLCAAQPSNALTTEEKKQAIIKEAQAQAEQVWKQIPWAQNKTVKPPFYPESVGTAYDLLSRHSFLKASFSLPRRGHRLPKPPPPTPEQWISEFEQPGMYLHLVIESLMINVEHLRVNRSNLTLSIQGQAPKNAWAGTLPTPQQLTQAVRQSLRSPAAVSSYKNLQKNLFSAPQANHVPPHDPNSLAGPVAFATQMPDAPSNSRDAAPITAAYRTSRFSTFKPAYLYTTPYCYTINFENVAASSGKPTGQADTVQVDDTIDSNQDSQSFTLLAITWCDNSLYPTRYENLDDGGGGPIESGQSAPVPDVDHTYRYFFDSVAGSLTMKLHRSHDGNSFTWLFSGSPLPVNQGGSVSFSVQPINPPTGTSSPYPINNAGATITFSNAPSVTTNPWP